MAEVYEIKRSEFERLAWLNETPERARRLEKARPEYVLVSTWAEFGKLHGHVFIRTRYINEKAFELSEVLESCSYDNVMYGGDTCVDEYEIWHVVDDEQESDWYRYTVTAWAHGWPVQAAAVGNYQTERDAIVTFELLRLFDSIEEVRLYQDGEFMRSWDRRK